MAVPSTIIDALLDLAGVVESNGRSIPVYPPSLGVSLMVEKIQGEIDINRQMMDTLPHIELLALAEKYPDEMSAIVALHTFKNRSDALDMEKLDARIEELTMSTEDLAVAYAMVMSFPTPEYYIGELGIQAELERRKAIADCKKPSTAVSTGAVTIYGGVIDVACARYGWTLDYVLWGISLHNLRLLLSDINNDVFLTEEEYKKARRHINKAGKSRRSVIDAGDPKNRDKVAEFFKDMD